MKYPRMLYKDGSDALVVQDEVEERKALKRGFQTSPVLTDEQKAAVHKARVAAGEIDDKDEKKAE